MTHLKKSVSIVALSLAFTPLAFVQESEEEQEGDERRLKSVTVTATKRSEDIQTIPVAVSALGEQDLEAFGVKNFTDYLIQLPGVTAGGSGPGQATIYIRGLASTTPNLTTAGVAGLAPNVSFYLDEQPLAQPGRNLDVYTADLQRIEVLSGPQGTLFGASSQAGTVRLITNKPDPSIFSASQKASTSFTDGGEMSNSVEAMLNIPLSERLALRGVIYTDKQGGYIDNVHGTLDAKQSARFRKQGVVRANGVPVSATRKGKQDGINLDDDDLTFLLADNAGLVEDNFNDTIYSGFRLSAHYDIDDDGTILISHSRQRLDSEGVFFSDPELKDDYSIQRYEDENFEDSFHNTSWTVNRRFSQLEALYTGAFTERTTDQIVDYTDYLFVGQYLPYYICDASVTNPGTGTDPSGTCQPPNLFVKSLTETKVQTHELRFHTPASNRYRVTFGAFFSDLELTELNDFTYPGSTRVLAYDGTTVGFAPNYPLTNTTAVTPSHAENKQGPGYYSDPGPFPAGVIFRNDIRRTDKQLGMFGEATFDISEEFAVTLGARWYDIEVDLEGSANSSFYNLGQTEDQQRAGTNISTQFASKNCPVNTTCAPDKATKDGMIFKLSGNWTPQKDMLFFATYSEGFRQGLLNRPGGTRSKDPNSNYVVPYLILSDEVKNIEFGWKTELLNNSLRFNGSAFTVQIEGLQTTIFDPSITNLFFSDNAADAELQGIEGDFTWVPESVEGLTLSGGFSFLNSEITEVITPTDDVKKGEPLAFAPSYQFNIQARYEWDIEQEFAGSVLTAHIMPQIVMSDSSYSDIIEINKIESDGYALIGGTFGVTADRWSAEVFATNLTNENALISNNFVFDRERTTPVRPRTIGIRMSYDF